MDERLLNSDEVAVMLNVSRATVYKMIHRGDLIPIRIGGMWRFRHAEILRYLRDKEYHEKLVAKRMLKRTRKSNH